MLITTYNNKNIKNNIIDKVKNEIKCIITSNKINNNKPAKQQQQQPNKTNLKSPKTTSKHSF